MPIRTGQQYLDSLKDDRAIYIDRERVTDVVNDRRFAGAAQTMAGLLDMQHDAAFSDALTYASPTTGEKVGVSHIEPKSAADVKRRGAGIKVWMDATLGMMGRSPDYKNVIVSSWASAQHVFNRDSFKGGDNVRRFYEHVRENDLVMTHVLVNPQVDRSQPAHLQESEIVAQVVKETDKGIVVRGARMVATLCALANEIFVMPAASRWETGEVHDSLAYSFGFAIPAATPGLKFLCRPSNAHLDYGSAMDHPLSLQYDESDGIAIFDDVEVPWENVFLYRDQDAERVIYADSGIGPHALHQSVVRATAKSEFMMALALAVARSTKIDEHVPVQVMLADTIAIAEFCRAMRTAAEADAAETRTGGWAPGIRPLQVWQNMFWKMYQRQCDIVSTLGAGGLVGVPSYAEVAGEVKADVEKYFQSVNADSPTRIKLFRLAYDASLSSYAGRQRLYEQYYTGDPNRTQALVFRTYPKDDYIQRIHDMLDDLESRQWPDGPAAFRRKGI